MSYIETLIEFAEKNECPGCGPTLQDMESSPLRQLYYEASEEPIWEKFCTCCGWHVMYIEGTYSFSSLPLDIEVRDSLDKFQCALQHPEHRANWPKPEPYDSQPDEYSELENKQYLREQHPEHFLITETQTCVLCSQWAPHQVVERKQGYTVLDLDWGNQAALCCSCFKKLFGAESHQYYPEVYTAIRVGDS